MQVRAAYDFAGPQHRLSGGDIADSRIAVGGTPAWSLFNIAAHIRRIRWVDINFGIRNIFDTAYRIHGSGVDGYGRNIWLGLEFKTKG